MCKQAIVLVVGALTASLLVVGCGGGDSEPSPIAKAAFLKRANEICREEKKKTTPEFEALIKLYGQGDKQKIKEGEIEYISDSLVPRVQAELDGIRDLGLPKGEEKQATEILDSIEKANDKIEEEPEIYPDRVNFSAAIAKAEKFGLGACPIG